MELDEDGGGGRLTMLVGFFGGNALSGIKRAPAIRDMPIKVKVREKVEPMTVTLKDVFRVPGVPCRLLRTGTIPRNGKFVESGSKQSYLRIERNGPKITLN